MGVYRVPADALVVFTELEKRKCVLKTGMMFVSSMYFSLVDLSLPLKQKLYLTHSPVRILITVLVLHFIHSFFSDSIGI